MASVVFDKDGNVVTINTGRGNEQVELPSEASACGRAALAALASVETAVQEEEEAN
jgi:hypothetical protein